MGTISDLQKRLDNIASKTKLRTNSHCALTYARALRSRHTAFINKYNTPTFLFPDERYTLLRHSHFRGGSQNRSFVYWRLFSPFGTMSTAMHLGQKSTKNSGVKLTIKGADIMYQEFGTGHLGSLYPHPEVEKQGWAYNVGPFIQTDRQTGIDYWVYGQYARIGSPAGHFIYDAINDTLKNENLKKYLKRECINYGKECIATIFEFKLKEKK